jgi:aminomethyltransferase
MEPLLKTVIHDQHVNLGAQMVAFGGWDMPVQYRTGILQEHLATRNHAGIFDVSHMGRIQISGPSSLAFLQHVLSNNAAGLEVGESQYTLIPNEHGGAIDDAYLYRFVPDAYLLVVNASNRKKDMAHFLSFLAFFPDVHLTDNTENTGMISLQGPRSREILAAITDSGHLPEPLKNRSSKATIKGISTWISRTGYTGEPLGFELFIPGHAAPVLWNLLIENGACPAGLGARDTLRLEAGLPLYGHELGTDESGNEIPVFSMPLSRIAVSFSDLKADSIGKPALFRQFQALKLIMDRNYSRIQDLPRMIFPLALTDKGVIRSGCQVYHGNKPVGYITSGTMIPYQKITGQGMLSRLSAEKGMRSVGLALLDSDLCEGDVLNVDIRGKMTSAVIVPYHLRSEAPPFARPILYDRLYQTETDPSSGHDVLQKKVDTLIDDASRNSLWRRQECINLIPSEQTPSKLVRLLSVLDPSGRYAEHKKMKAFSEVDIYYYQGVDFIEKVEHLLHKELCAYFGCSQVETRPISGQMANTGVFSALCDYLNRSDRKSEQRRIRRVLNHHIIKGGHLSAQPMGALRDFVARDPQTERPSVINFPVLEENPYQIDVAAACKMIADYQPELIIFGKSMILHREPIADIRSFVDSQKLDCVLLYDMAHVLGLCGPFYQDPFREGADIVTGSTHKTFFGTQRGVIASDFSRDCVRYPLWEAIERRAFPGSVSNHHLGTLLGLLLATFEMNAFKTAYQKQVIDNAKAFAAALKDCSLNVAGDPAISFTETHQVILSVGYARGPEMARRLEDNHIIVNYQAAPDEEGFTASGALRMGVAEMTRFGMKETDFQRLAELIYDVIVQNKPLKSQVTAFRKRFQDMQYCFSENELPRIQKLLEAIV